MIKLFDKFLKHFSLFFQFDNIPTTIFVDLGIFKIKIILKNI